MPKKLLVSSNHLCQYAGCFLEDNSWILFDAVIFGLQNKFTKKGILKLAIED
jgi:hypothetical protein